MALAARAPKLRPIFTTCCAQQCQQGADAQKKHPVVQRRVDIPARTLRPQLARRTGTSALQQVWWTLDDDAPNRRPVIVPSSKSDQVWHARKVKRLENIFQRKSVQRASKNCDRMRSRFNRCFLACAGH